MPRFENQTTTINISTLSFVKVLIILGLIGFLYFIRDVLAVLFVAIILASALGPTVNVFERKGVPRLAGILLIYLLILSVIGLVIMLVIPPIVQEYAQLAARFPEYADRIIQTAKIYFPEVDVIEQLKNFFQSIQSTLLQSAGGIVSRVFGFLQGFVGLILVFVVTLYIIMQEGALRKAFHLVTPIHFRPLVDELTGKIQAKIGLWLRAQAILSFIIFSLTFLGLTILGVDYALTLAIVAGLTEFMPIIGPIIGSIPAIFIALAQSPILALWVLLLFLLVQRVENDFIVPRVMHTTVGINPLVSIIALLIGGKIGGLGGILLAIPVATVVTTILSEFTDAIDEPVAEEPL